VKGTQMLYKMKVQIETVFNCLDNKTYEAAKDAMAKEGISCNNPNFIVKEIEKLEDIPKDWKNSIPWGEQENGEEKTCSEIIKEELARLDKYEQLRLKF
jgi:hypothetical protein